MFLFLATELTTSAKAIVTSTPAKTKHSRKGRKKERKKEGVSDEEKEQTKKRSEDDALHWERQPFHGNMFHIIYSIKYERPCFTTFPKHKES